MANTGATVTAASSATPDTDTQAFNRVDTSSIDASAVAPGPDVLPSPTPAGTLSLSPSIRSTLSWKTVRSTFSVSEKTSAQLGWAIAFLSVLFTVVALSPAFKAQDVSEKALKLAEWTALKDFIEECREEIAAGIRSQACLKAMNAQLPPPPYVKAGVFERTRKRLAEGPQQINETLSAIHVEQLGRQIPKAIQGIVVLAIILTACVFLFLSFESNRSRLRRRSFTREAIEKKSEEPTSVSPTASQVEMNSGTLRYPPVVPEAALRRRAVRTHPIYRHASLGGAIHAEDIAEIKLRLQNGEDLNEHWPYLIYRLAITPKAEFSAKRLEIARLCLDFGADVNALKGWNGQSALNIAIHFGNVEVAKVLIANGATVCYGSDNNNITALHHCVRLAATGSSSDALEIMELLFAHGALANQSDRLAETPLHKLLIEAWFNRHDPKRINDLYPIALCLVEHGAGVPVKIKEKYTIDNPLWDLVYMTIWDSQWPEKVGPDLHLIRMAKSLKAQKELEGALRERVRGGMEE